MFEASSSCDTVRVSVDACNYSVRLDTRQGFWVQMDTIGERLKIERQRLGLSQEEFAAAGGVQRRAQIRYEAGERNPDAEYLAALPAMGVDVLFVLTGTRSVVIANDLSPAEAALVDNFRHSAPEDREAIQQIGSAFAQRSRTGRDDGEETRVKACGGSGK